MHHTVITKRRDPFSFKLLGLLFALEWIPGYHYINPYTKPGNWDSVFLPTYDRIKLPQDTPQPIVLLENLIKKAKSRILLHKCECRALLSCKNHSEDLSCMFLGNADTDIPEKYGRKVSEAEALEHVKKAQGDKGLIPYVGRTTMDNSYFGVTSGVRFLAVCFCCSCCCCMRYSKYMPAYLRRKGVYRFLDGLTIKVDPEKCIGCGKCKEECFVSAIKMKKGKALIGKGCAGCGRCAMACPEGAIEISIDDPLYIEKAQKRYEELCEL